MVASLFPLKINNASVRKRGKTVLGPIDLTLGGEGFTVILGPNGAGKTTLLRLMHGIETAATGTVAWAIPNAQAHGRQSFVFQSPIVLRRSVQDNLIYPLIITGTRKADAVDQAQKAAGSVGLGDVLDQTASKLSGGEKQKLALARALVNKPDIVFLDEPCSNLDGRATREIEAVLKQASAQGTRIVMTTHNLGQARRLASDILFLLHGKLYETASAADFFTNPQTPAAGAFINGDIVE